jgi:hypothetical protein
MKDNIFIVVLVLFISLSSCSSNQDNHKSNPKVIDVAGSIGRGRVVNLSEIADSIEYIPLETNEESLVGTPGRGLFYESGLVYLLEAKDGSDALKVFNKNGAFVRQISRCGRGPQEYESISYLQIDSKTGNLLFQSYYNKIVEYTSEGQFIRGIKFDRKIIKTSSLWRDINKIDDNKYLFKVDVSKEDVYSAIVVDSTLSIKLLVEYPEPEKKLLRELPRSYSFLSPKLFKFRDSVRLINGTSEYVLNIDKDLQIDTAFVINYGQYKINNKYVHYRAGSHSPYIFLYNRVFESSDYLFLQFHLGSLAHKQREMRSGSGMKISYPITCAVFNKIDGVFTFADQPAYNQIGFKDDLGGGPAIWPSYISEDDYMVSYINAIDFINHAETGNCSERFRQIASGLKDTDNPVLVLVKLKKQE